MRSVRVRHTRILVGLLLGVAACSGGSGGGGPLSCGGGCMTPLPAPYDGPKTNNAVDAKLTGAAFDYLNGNWQQLLTAFLPNASTDAYGNPVINMPVPCTVVPVNGYGFSDVNICDSNFNDQCDPGEACNNINIHIVNFAVEPGDSPQPGQVATVNGTISLEISTGNINISTSNKPAECVWLSHMEATVSYDNYSPNAPLTLTLPITLTLDGRIDPQHPITSFSVGNIDGLQNLDSSYLDASGHGACGSVWSSIIDFAKGTVFNFLIQQLNPMLQSKVQSAVESATCRKCGNAGDPSCPLGQNGGEDSSCQSNQCVPSSGGACVPMNLGIEGLVSPGSLLGQYGVPADASLAISAVAGGSLDSSAPSSPGTGLTLGVIGGIQSETGDAPHLAPCVPDLPAPGGAAPPVPDFDGQSPVPGYHVGVGVSDLFLNQGAYQAHRSGTMCLSISGDTVQLLNTGLFKTFLPSLGLLAGSQTQDAPMLVALRPLAAPTIDIGEGTYDPVTKKPIDPLITVTMHNVAIDIYALIEDRWSRLFSMTLDVQLPLSLIIDGCPQGITPAIGDLKNLITITKAPGNSELLAEDPAVLQGLIPAVISMAQPALASALKPISVPAVNGFTLKLDGMLGIGNRATLADGGPGTFDDLGVYGEIAQAGTCDAATVHTFAQLASTSIPTADEMRPAAGQNLPWPSATVRVGATGYQGDIEYGYRVDDGLWTTFKPGPELTVSDPRFLLQGHHTISVRGRPAHGKGISDPHPAQVDFLVDWEAPAVKLAQTAKGFEVQVLDNVTGPQALKYRYTVGDAQPSAWGPERPIDAQAIQEAGKLTVEVRDEAGNVGTSTWRGAAAVATSGITPPSGPELAKGQPTGGCSSTGGFSLAALLGLGLALGTRKRR